MSMNKFFLGLIAWAALLMPAHSYAYDVELVITYDSEAEAYAKRLGSTVEAMIDNYITNTNKVFLIQSIPIRLLVNKKRKLELPESKFVTGQSRFRTEYDADYAMHFTVGLEDPTLCGFAILRTSEGGYSHGTYYSYLDISCGWHTMAHELGHNFGLDDPAMEVVDKNTNVSHWVQTPPGQFTGVYPYGGGYSEFGRFGTIMLGNYQWIMEIFGGGESIGLFSDAVYSGHSKYPKIGDSSRDSARALKNIAPYLSSGDRCTTTWSSGWCSEKGLKRVRAKLIKFDYGSCKGGCTTYLSTPGAPITMTSDGKFYGVVRQPVDAYYTKMELEYSIDYFGDITMVKTCKVGPEWNVRPGDYNIHMNINSDSCYAYKK